MKLIEKNQETVTSCGVVLEQKASELTHGPFGPHIEQHMCMPRPY